MSIWKILFAIIGISVMAGLAYFVSDTVKKPTEVKRGGLSFETKSTDAADWLDFQVFKDLHGPNFPSAIVQIDDNWKPGYLTMLFESMRVIREQSKVDQLISLGAKKAKLSSGQSIKDWLAYISANPAELPSYYSEFKAFNWKKKDSSFVRYFENRPVATIRLDEVVFGGVKRDGIPPLKNPKMIDADDAVYLDESNVTYGITINGDSRAYPKRILAWHEMFKDTIGGISVCGVY